MADLRAAWVQSPDDPTLGGDVVSYELARSTGPNATSIIATIPATAATDDTDFEDSIAPGTYFYRVRAVSTAGRRSVWSNEVSIAARLEINRVRFTLSGNLMAGVSLSGGLSGSVSIAADLER